MKTLKADFKMKPDAVYFVALGGCGMFGANMSLYGHNGQWIMVDCGLGFADDTMPGVDILLADPSFAEQLGKNLLGILVTHSHEDHTGGLQHLWPRLKAPLYATPFSAGRIIQDLNETPWGGQTPIYEIQDDEKMDLGPFTIEAIKMAHSIPEMRAFAISVKGVGTIVHTGDWKIDPDPLEGDLTDEKKLREIGQNGVLAVMGDSTNAMVPGHSGSERDVLKTLTEVFSEFDTRIAITCFSTSVARLHSIYEAATANGRHVCLLGRSLWQVDEVARANGYLKSVPPFLSADDAEMIPASHIVYVCTGSQGEPRAALMRISQDEHRHLRLAANDVVIFSSRVIPGNERGVDRIRNRLLGKGVHIITDRDALVHVSGHPYRDELKQLYSWLKPKVVVPVHGEHLQQEKHAALAKECGAEQTVIPANGDVIELTATHSQVIGTVQHGILAIEGKRIVAVDHEAILTRKRMMWNGSVIVTVVLDEHGDLLAPPKMTALGLLDENSELDNVFVDDAVREITKKIKNLPKDVRRDDEEMSEAVRVTARRFFADRFDRKPQTRVHLVRV